MPTRDPSCYAEDFTFSRNNSVFTIRGGKKTSENSENDENRFKRLSRYPNTSPLSRLAVAKEQCDNRDNRFKRLPVVTFWYREVDPLKLKLKK